MIGFQASSPTLWAAIILGLVALGGAITGECRAGKVVLIGDDWALSDFAFDLESSDGTALAQSIASFFSPSAGGDFLAISDSSPVIPFGRRGVNGREIAEAMESFGHKWTVDPETSLTLESLLPYDAVFLAGTIGTAPADVEALTQYVIAGGGVLVMGGSGEFGGAADESRAWAPFLSSFGLTLGDTWFGGAAGSLDEITLVDAVAPPGEGADMMAWSEGQLASVTDPGNPRTHVALRGNFSAFGGGPQGEVNDVMAVYDAPFLAGDFNDDGTVDAADYSVWRDNLGKRVALPGDATAGLVDQDDYRAWRSSFGSSAPIRSSTAVTTIPEPGAALHLAALWLSWILVSKRRMTAAPVKAPGI